MTTQNLPCRVSWLTHRFWGLLDLDLGHLDDIRPTKTASAVNEGLTNRVGGPESFGRTTQIYPAHGFSPISTGLNV